MKKLTRILLFVFVLCGATSVFSQQPYAALTGVVTDQNGAIIQGATVTATNKGTNLSRTAATNDDGVYTIANLPVGEYNVKFEAKNFKETIYERIQLNGTPVDDRAFANALNAVERALIQVQGSRPDLGDFNAFDALPGDSRKIDAGEIDVGEPPAVDQHQCVGNCGCAEAAQIDDGAGAVDAAEGAPGLHPRLSPDDVLQRLAG